MKKKYLLYFLLLFFFKSVAQSNSNSIEFTSDNQKLSGKLITSLNNLKDEILVEFSDKEKSTFKIKNIHEITINNDKYVSSYNKIDLTLTNNIDHINNNPNPDYQEMWLLLKTLVEGDYNLYEFNTGSFSQFYFNTPETREIKPLVYKQYSPSRFATKINGQFRNQLYKEAQHPTYSYDRYKKIEYKKNTLIKYFNAINSYDAEKGIEKTKIQFSVFAGMAINNININNIGEGTPQESFYYAIGYDQIKKIKTFESYTSPILGAAIEIPMSNKYESVLFTNLSLSSYKQKYNIEEIGLKFKHINYELKSTVFLLNIGYKHYFTVFKNVQLYGQGAIALTTFINSKNLLTWENQFGSQSDKGFKSATNFGGSLGIGFKINKKYYFETNFKEPLNSGNTMKSFTLGYTF